MAKPKTSPRHRPMSDINVVPYIDVMLVLLVVFMITAPMLVQGVKVDLPNAEAPPIELPQDQKLLIVSVNDKGQYFLNLGESAEQARDLLDLIGRVSKIKQENAKIPIMLEGDERVPYGVVVKLMAALQGVGINDVGLVIDSPEREQ